MTVNIVDVIQVSHVTVTYRDGRVAQMENVYVRGSKVRFIILPDMLRNAPMFKSKMTMGGAAGRGKSGMIRSSGILNIFISSMLSFILMNVMFILLFFSRSWTRPRWTSDWPWWTTYGTWWSPIGWLMESTTLR